MSNKPTRPILIIAGLLCAASAQAQLYKSVGPDGRITYSDAPPAAARRVGQKSLGGRGSDTSNLPDALAEPAQARPLSLYSGAKCPPGVEGRPPVHDRRIPLTGQGVST